MKWITILLLFIPALAFAQSGGIQNIFREKTKIENPFQLRDPFKPPQTKAEGRKKGRGFEVTGKGQYSNIQEAPLEQLNPAQLKLVGVLIGKERRALVGGENKKIIILKEGMKIGPDGAEIKAILPGGLVLVEKIVNVYGEEEFLETVIPISR